MNDFLKFLTENKDGIGVFTSLLTATLAFFSAILIPLMLAKITGKISHQNAIAVQLNDKKRALFEKFVDMFFELLNKSENKSPSHQKELESNMLNFKKQLLLNASEQTLIEFNRWVKSTQKTQKKPNATAVSMDRFFASLRRDIGLSDNEYQKNFWEFIGMVIKKCWNLFLPRKRTNPRVQLFITQDK